MIPQAHFNKVRVFLELSILILSVILAGLVVFQIMKVAFPHSSASLSQTEVTQQISVTTPTPTLSRSHTILFGGDVMFDRLIRQRIDQYGVNFVLEPLRAEFASSDLVVANLEGPITTNPSKSSGSVIGSTANYIFTFDPKIVPALKEFNLTVNLGNNHIGNFGVDGIEQTKSFLKNGDVRFFGNTGTELESTDRIILIQVGSYKVGFVNMNQFVEHGFEESLKDIAVAKEEADIVVVYTHWGNEYVPIANTVIQDLAHTLIDAGADVVIGSHPHVIEQSEMYHQKMIFYSLGNLVFDQYQVPETQVGELVKMKINPDKTLEFSTKLVTLQQNGQTKLKE